MSENDLPNNRNQPQPENKISHPDEIKAPPPRSFYDNRHIERIEAGPPHSFIGPVSPAPSTYSFLEKNEHTGALSPPHFIVETPSPSSYRIRRKGLFILLLTLMILSGLVLILFVMLH